MALLVCTDAGGQKSKRVWVCASGQEDVQCSSILRQTEFRFSSSSAKGVQLREICGEV